MIIQQNNVKKQVVINCENVDIDIHVEIHMGSEEKKASSRPEKGDNPESYEDKEDLREMEQEYQELQEFQKLWKSAEKEIQKTVNEFCVKKKDNLRLEQAYLKLASLDKMQEKRFVDKANRAYECSTYLEFWLLRDKNARKLIRANYCRDRLCVTCAWRRSLKTYIQNVQCFREINDGRYLFLTLTAKNVMADELSDEITNYIESWQRMSKDKLIKKYLLGTIRALEVTYNRKFDTYHPHLHILLHVSSNYFVGRNYLSQKRWRQMWEGYANLDYISQVSIKAVKSDDAGMLAEISKYCVKFNDLSELDQNTYTRVIGVLDQALRNRRLVSYTGMIRETRKRLKMKNEIEDFEFEYDLDKDEAIRLIYQYNFATSTYDRTEVK